MSEGIRVEISCWNCDCENYWEDMCLKQWRKNEVMFHDEEGKCSQFVRGINSFYQNDIENLKVFTFENGETEWVIARDIDEAMDYYEGLVGKDEIEECKIDEFQNWKTTIMRVEVSEEVNGLCWIEQTMLITAKEMYPNGYTEPTVISSTAY